MISTTKQLSLLLTQYEGHVQNWDKIKAQSTQYFSALSSVMGRLLIIRKAAQEEKGFGILEELEDIEEVKTVLITDHFRKVEQYCKSLRNFL